METISNAASAAKSAVFGISNTDNYQSNDSGREPVSGETGNTKSGEPYDAGNAGSKSSSLRWQSIIHGQRFPLASNADRFHFDRALIFETMKPPICPKTEEQ